MPEHSLSLSLSLSGKGDVRKRNVKTEGKVAIYQPRRGLTRNQSYSSLILDVLFPDLPENKYLQHKPLRLWYLVMEARVDKYSGKS